MLAHSEHKQQRQLRPLLCPPFAPVATTGVQNASTSLQLDLMAPAVAAVLCTSGNDGEFGDSGVPLIAADINSTQVQYILTRYILSCSSILITC